MTVTGQNPVVDAADAIIHGVIMNVAFELAANAAVADMPWLGLPVINSVFRYMLGLAFGYVDKAAEQAAAFSILDAQTSSQSSAYKEAVSALQIAQASGNADSIAYATKNLKETLARLIHTDGS